MAQLSLRSSWQQRYAGSLPSDGLRANHDFYRKTPSAFPYHNLRALIEGLEWPPNESYGYTSENYDYPREKDDTAWVHDIQGVAHDDRNWFFSNQYRLWKIPVDRDLNGDVGGDILNAPIPPDLCMATGSGICSGWNHFGAIDYHGGQVYVPLESEGKHRDSWLLVFDENLHEVARCPFGPRRHKDVIFEEDAQGGEGPWCAVWNELLFSSPFYDGPGPLSLYVYPSDVGRFRGGTFSAPFEDLFFKHYTVKSAADKGKI
jgi:hypothetical protein